MSGLALNADILLAEIPGVGPRPTYQPLPVSKGGGQACQFRHGPRVFHTEGLSLYHIENDRRRGTDASDHAGNHRRDLFSKFTG